MPKRISGQTPSTAGSPDELSPTDSKPLQGSAKASPSYALSIREAFLHLSKEVVAPTGLLHAPLQTQLLAELSEAFCRSAVPSFTQKAAQLVAYDTTRNLHLMSGLMELNQSLDLLIERLEREERSAASDRVQLFPPPASLGVLEEWGVCSNTLNCFAILLEALQPPLSSFPSASAIPDGQLNGREGSYPLSLGAVVSGAEVLPASAVAGGIYRSTHRTIRLRLERSIALLRRSLRANVEATMRQMRVGGGDAWDTNEYHSATETLFSTRLGMLKAQEWLLEELSGLYHRLVRSTGYVTERLPTATGMASKRKQQTPSVEVASLEWFQAYNLLLQFFYRLLRPNTTTLEKGSKPDQVESTRWSDALKSCTFFSALPFSFPFVNGIGLDAVNPHHLLIDFVLPAFDLMDRVEASQRHTHKMVLSDAKLDPSLIGLFMAPHDGEEVDGGLLKGTEELHVEWEQPCPRSVSDISTTTKTTLTTHFKPSPLRQNASRKAPELQSHVDPRLLANEKGRLLAHLLGAASPPAEVVSVSTVSTQSTSRLNASRGKKAESDPSHTSLESSCSVHVALQSSQFTPDFFDWASSLAQDIHAPPPCTHLFPREGWRRNGASRPHIIPPPAASSTVPWSLTETPLVPSTKPVPPPRSFVFSSTAQENHQAPAPRLDEDSSAQAAFVALLKKKKLQKKHQNKDRGIARATEVSNLASQSTPPCVFANGVHLTALTSTSMALERPTTQNPWDLVLECIEKPEEYPDLLPIRLLQLPPTTCSASVKSSVRSTDENFRHPFCSFFNAETPHNWYIDTINGIRARHPEKSIPWMKQLTKMVLTFRRL